MKKSIHSEMFSENNQNENNIAEITIFIDFFSGSFLRKVIENQFGLWYNVC